MRHDIVCMAADGFDDTAGKALVLADIKEVFKAQKDVFASPKIPAVKFCLHAVRGEASVRLLGGKHIKNRSDKRIVQNLILGILIGKDRAAHHFAPVFALPAEILIIREGAVLFDKHTPGIGIDQKLVLNEASRAIRHALAVNGACRHLEKHVGFQTRSIRCSFAAQRMNGIVFHSCSVSFLGVVRHEA